jgi:hypothetical protein
VENFEKEIGGYCKAARIFEIEIIETLRIKCGKGINKYFNYLLIEDEKFHRFKALIAKSGFSKRTLHLFLSGCLYLGKGQADRPFMHIREAVDEKNDSEKHEAIRNVWDNNGGVIVLTFFHDSSSYVAATREAIMIDFIGLENLTNERRGSFYGGVRNWDQNVLNNMGKYFITKIMAYSINHHVEPIRQEDIPRG